MFGVEDLSQPEHPSPSPFPTGRGSKPRASVAHMTNPRRPGIIRRMPAPSPDLLDRLFDLRGRRSTVGRELRGAIATYLTMVYILFANAHILAAAGVPFPSSVACTAAAAGVCCILMGFVANFPLALASGMGLNAIVAGVITQRTGSWQAAMGLIVLDGVVTLALVVAGLREAIMQAIPRDLRLAIGAGIGLFIAFIGLANAKLIVPTGDAMHPIAPANWRDVDVDTLRTMSLAAAGLVITATLMLLRLRGALVIGILAATAIAFPLRLTHWPQPQPVSFAAAFHADVITVLRPRMLPIVLPLLFAVIMVDFFDTLGTASAIAEEAKLTDEQGRIPGVRRILMIDSISASIGGIFGVSSVTSYIESAAGVAEGARTGLHSVFVGVMFLISIVAAPWAGVVPAVATAPALILVGFLMMSQVARINFDDLATAIPAFVVLLTIPLTWSIAHGIGYGFILYVAMHVLSGRVLRVPPPGGSPASPRSSACPAGSAARSCLRRSRRRSSRRGTTTASSYRPRGCASARRCARAASSRSPRETRSARTHRLPEVVRLDILRAPAAIQLAAVRAALEHRADQLRPDQLPLLAGATQS
jgi:AGZA family xanthine/uracil permease-like MFS transporter